MRDPRQDFNPVRAFLFTFASIGFFLVMQKYYPDLRWFFPPSLVIIFGLISMMLVAKSIWWKFRDTGFRVQAGGVSGSILGEPFVKADPSMGKGFKWAIFGLGAVPPFKGRMGVLVVPLHQVYKVQGFYNSLTLVTRWNKFHLPSVVQEFFEENPEEFNLDFIYYGKHSQDFIDNSSEYSSSHEEQLKAKDSIISSIQLSNKNKFSHFEELKNVVDKVGGKTNTFQRMLEAVKKKEEDTI